MLAEEIRPEQFRPLMTIGDPGLRWRSRDSLVCPRRRKTLPFLTERLTYRHK